MTEHERELEKRRRRGEHASPQGAGEDAFEPAAQGTLEQTIQTGSSGGVSSMGIYADGSRGDSTVTGSPEKSNSASPDDAKKPPASRPSK